MGPLVECVPNFSEGRRADVIAALVAAIEGVEGVQLLHVTSDWDHNRTVITFAGTPAAVAEGAFAGARTAARFIDLNRHRGVHPRIGALDVLPFVPLEGTTMADCVALAQQVGRRIGEELGIPVYLYEAAATRPDRRNLAEVRRGGYEGLRLALGRDHDRVPDYGPAVLGPAGATAVGARNILIAYNVFLDTGDVEIAKAIARAIRASNGGLPAVKALGLLVGGRAQVSINLTDYRTTSLYQVWSAITTEAARHGARAIESEVIGLIPEDALLTVAEAALRLEQFQRAQVLERRLASGSQARQSQAEA